MMCNVILLMALLCFGWEYFQTPSLSLANQENKTNDARIIIEWKKAPDLQTGHEVWQITNHDSPSAAFYFEKQAFTSDDRYLMFYSVRSGSQQLFRADLNTGELKQMTDLERIGSANMHPNGQHCLFQSGVSLLRLDVETGKIDTVFKGIGRFPSQPQWAGSYSADGDITVVSCRIEDSLKLYQVNISKDEAKLIFSWPGNYSHPQVCPRDPNLVTFVPYPDTQNDTTLPMEKRARTWIVDARTGIARQFLTCPYGYRATHESWSSDGERFFFFKKTQPGWIPVTICSINREGTDWQEHYTHKTIRLGHGISSSNRKWFISDGQDPGQNPLILVDLVTGKGTILCWPNASIKGRHKKHAHVHPFFSSSGRYICFTSDRTGTAQVYIVPVPKDLIKSGDK